MSNYTGFVGTLICCVAGAVFLIRSGSIGVPLNAPVVVEFLGITITSFAFVVSCYIGLIAVTAYRHIRDLEEKLNSVEIVSKMIVEQRDQILTTSDEVKLLIVSQRNDISEEISAIRRRAVAFSEYITTMRMNITEVIDEVGRLAQWNDGILRDQLMRFELVNARLEFELAQDNRRRMIHARTLVALGGSEDFKQIYSFLVTCEFPDAEEISK